MTYEELENLEPALRSAGKAVADLPRVKAPAGLAERTLARISASLPAVVVRRVWILRPITNPFARCAAAAAILLLLAPLSDLELARNVGSKIESELVGHRVVDHMENIMDDVLPRGVSDSYSQSELDAFNNVYSMKTVQRTPLKIQVRSPKANQGA